MVIKILTIETTNFRIILAFLQHWLRKSKSQPWFYFQISESPHLFCKIPESVVSEIRLCAVKHTVFSSPICFFGSLSLGYNNCARLRWSDTQLSHMNQNAESKTLRDYHLPGEGAEAGSGMQRWCEGEPSPCPESFYGDTGSELLKQTNRMQSPEQQHLIIKLKG